MGTLSVFASNNRKLPIYCVETDKKQVAISFDAAWGADDTEQLIGILKDYKVKATFFVVGAWVDKYPHAVEMLHNGGHSIQNHSNTHANMTQLTNAKMAEELSICNEKIASITGKTPLLFRPPYGDYNNNVIDVTYAQKLYPIQWDVDSRDWFENATPQTIIDNVVSKVKSGSIILMHNDAEYTPAALPTILKTLQDKGYEFVLIEDLIYKENYEIKHDGTQCKIS
jgi:polysaccharide deacetylase family sporulation protein PdaB